MLPDIQQLEEKINAHNKEERHILEERIQTVIKTLDARLVQFRKETDFDYFKTVVAKKADSDSVKKEI